MNCGLKRNILEYTPFSVAHVEVIQFICRTSATNLSNDRVDFLHVKYWCWRHIKIMWPFSASSFRTLWMSWISGRNKFRRHFFLATAPGFRIRKIPMIPNFCLSRQVSPLLQPSTRQGMHLSASLESSTLRRVLNSFLPSRQVSL